MGNIHAHRWQVTTPFGEVFVVEGALQNFCNIHKLPFNTFFRGMGVVPPPNKKANRSTIKRHRLVGWRLDQLDQKTVEVHPEPADKCLHSAPIVE